jgi:hypothetical protein
MKTVAVVVLGGLIAIECLARLSREWSYKELVAESDFVGLLEPVANQPAKDVSGSQKISYEAIDTRFRIDAVLKADGKATKELTVLHFSDERSVPAVNGPSFVCFVVGPPQYLAFLKRRADGRYEPVTGQEDADQSFREVHASSDHCHPNASNKALQPTADR